MQFLSGILPYIEIVLSILLIVAILLQQSDASVGAAFGGDNFSSVHRTRRGFERTLFISTIVISILFALSAFLALVV
ncbi:MAG TPA: preprotein translocase subunit SecG [Candidatus Paceibacterota bacterium]|nr:preprotein translocase subunit SecG [Candidatus Paceibacterota bacterium]